MKQEINQVSKEDIKLEKKIEELARRLEKIDKFEYKEIIEGLRKYNEEILRERKGNTESL
jgi:hypothetical protein